jgi:hypothetical protein
MLQNNGVHTTCARPPQGSYLHQVRLVQRRGEMTNNRWSLRDGIKGDCSIEAARQQVELAKKDGKEPGKYDAWLARMRTSYETSWCL